MKRLFVTNIKREWSRNYIYRIAMVAMIVIALMTGDHLHRSLSPSTAKTPAIQSTSTTTTAQLEQKKAFQSLMGIVSTLVIPIVAAIFALSSIKTTHFAVKVSTYPILRVIAKKKGNGMVMYAENIGKGPLFLTDINIELGPIHPDGVVVLKEQSVLRNVEILAKNINESTQVSLAEREKMTLLSFTNKEGFHEEVLQALRCIPIQAKFTDVLGNKYEEKIKPEVYANYEEFFQHEDTKPSNT